MSITERRSGAEQRGTAPRRGDLYASAKKARVVRAWLEGLPRDEDGAFDASQRDVANGTGLPLSTVRRALRLLLDTNELILLELGVGGEHTSRYRFPAEHPAPAGVVAPVA